MDSISQYHKLTRWVAYIAGIRDKKFDYERFYIPNYYDKPTLRQMDSYLEGLDRVYKPDSLLNVKDDKVLLFELSQEQCQAFVPRKITRVVNFMLFYFTMNSIVKLRPFRTAFWAFLCFKLTKNLKAGDEMMSQVVKKIEMNLDGKCLDVTFVSGRKLSHVDIKSLVMFDP